MSSLRFRLLTVIALALVGAAVSQAAGAGSNDARPLAPGSSLTEIVSALASSHMPAVPGTVRGVPLPAGLHATAAGARVSKARSALGTGFTATGTTFGSATVYSVSSADYDADGKLDVLINGCVDEICTDIANTLYHNNGDGTFSVNTTAGLPESWVGSNSWADYDGDGFVDVLISGCSLEELVCETLESRLYHNDGDGTFTLNGKAVLPGALNIYNERNAAWIDYNNDGRLDLLMGGSAFGIAAKLALFDTSARLYRNNGDGSFSEVTSASSGLPGFYAFDVQATDYDSDGYIDVLISGCSDETCDSFSTKLYRNKGNGTFSEDTRAALPALVLAWAVWNDFDGDGAPDLLITGYDPISERGIGPGIVTKLMHNNGDGTFRDNGSSGLPALDDFLIRSGDYDSDGDVDVMFNAYDTTQEKYVTPIYLNNGAGSFSLDPNTGLPDEFAWVEQGDYNSDGGLDLILFDLPPTANGVLYQNATTSGGGNLSAPDYLEVRLTGARQATFRWKKSSSKTLDNRITYNLRVGTSPGASNIVPAMSSADGVRYVPAEGNAGGRTFAKITLPHKGNFYFSVQAVNGSLVGSVFSREKKFIVPGRVSIHLTETKINSCGEAPRRTAATGRVNPIFTPVATIILKKRMSLHGAWREIARRQTSHSGNYGFHQIGRKSKRSFWLKVIVTPEGGGSVTSAAKYVRVSTRDSCSAPQ